MVWYIKKYTNFNHKQISCSLYNCALCFRCSKATYPNKNDITETSNTLLCLLDFRSLPKGLNLV